MAEARQPLVIEDVTADPRFSAETARSTGYVPRGLMAVPLLRGERVLGVLNVLDRPERRRFSVAELDLLSLFADQAAIALDLLVRARRTQAVLDAGPDMLTRVARLAAVVDALDGERRAAGLRLLSELAQVLA